MIKNHKQVHLTSESNTTVFALSTNQYLYIQERSDEVALDITLFDKDKKEIDGGVFETDLDINEDETIIECMDFIDLGSLSFHEISADLIEEFDM